MGYNKNSTNKQQPLAKSEADVVAKSFVHFINFIASRQFTAPKTPPSASGNPLAVNVEQPNTNINMTKTMTVLPDKI